VVEQIFASSKELFPKMPMLDILPPRKTVHWPLGPIPHDESSNVGNLAVLENIFQGQYRLPEEAFENTLFLIYGDQKTVQRIRTIKRRRRGSTKAYDTLKWALPVPALFHLKMNLLYMLSRCHFGGPDQDQSTLYDAMNYWGRKRITKAKAEFFALEELVIHSFQARIVALMWNKLSRTGLGRHAEDMEATLRNLPPSGFYTLVDEIQKEYSFLTHPNLANPNFMNPEAGKPKSAKPKPKPVNANSRSSLKDNEVRNHYLFLRQAQTYMILRYAIKHGDIGLIRRAIDRCCVYFHGSGQHKYAYEMLYLQRLFLASQAPLTRAILSNSLVNLRGSVDSFFETDRLVELHNGNMKELFNAKRGSSITLEHLFRNYSLNSAYLKNMSNEVERLFSARSNSDHSPKSAQTDIRLMAERLAASSIVYARRGRAVKYPAPDVLAKGAIRLASDALAKFNANECYDDQGFNDSLLDEEEQIGEGEDFFDFPDSD
jgi:hypothetical protein